MRDRLIKLLWQSYHKTLDTGELATTEQLADHLIANGVIVPPCKPGDELNGQIVDEVIYKTMANFNGSITTINEIHLRDKDARGPIYTAGIISFEEAERFKKGGTQNGKI